MKAILIALMLASSAYAAPSLESRVVELEKENKQLKDDNQQLQMMSDAMQQQNGRLLKAMQQMMVMIQDFKANCKK